MSWANILKNQNEIVKDIIEDEKEVRACLIVLEMIKDYKSIRDAFNRTWENSRVLVSMDAEWMRQFAGDGYNMNDVNWSDITKGVMKLYDQIIDNI